MAKMANIAPGSPGAFVPRGMRTGLPGLGGSALAPAPRYLPPVATSLPEAAPAADAAPTITIEHLYELGLTTAAMGFHTAAIEALSDCTARAPDHADAWRRLAELLRLAGEDAKADAAAERALAVTTRPKGAVSGRVAGRPEKAERRLRDSLHGVAAPEAASILRDRLVAQPRDAAAMRLLARLEEMARDPSTAWRLLERALDICPDYVGAREDYVDSLMKIRSNDPIAAVEIGRLLRRAPRNPRYRMMNAYVMIFTGRPEAAAEILKDLLRENPGDAHFWQTYGQALRFLGRRDESERAYRKCLALKPAMGEAYWALADLKGKCVTDLDVAAMRDLLEDGALDESNRMHVLYALAQTLERAGDFPASFRAYAEGAELFRVMAARSDRAHDRPRETARVRRAKAVFSRDNLETRLPQAPALAADALTPIFVVGMPRAGSTLVEQILASHSLVEGTRELPLVGDVTRTLAASRALLTRDAYPERVLELTREQLAGFGAQVLERSSNYRNTDRPYFIDKRPWNWLEVGLIHLMLPHAKIIDIRREPMAACFAMYKQLLPNDAAFSYDFGDLADYYNNYVSLMTHWQEVLPGRVHFVQYESLVADADAEIRRMLDYCGLPFEEGCLRFWETDRAVSTPSAEQVRRPIFRDALQQWRNFEPWLEPLRQALDQPAAA